MELNTKNSVVIKYNTANSIIIILDASIDFDELLILIRNKFKEASNFLKNSRLKIAFEGRKLSNSELNNIISIILETTDVIIDEVVDSEKLKKLRKENVNNSMPRKDIEKKDMEISEVIKPLKEPYKEPSVNDLTHNAQLFKGTLRSGQILESDNSLVILGDVNPGANVISNGNVIVLGSLKGSAVAGSSGNETTFVIALDMNPVQIRIGNAIGRSEDKKNKKKKDSKDPMIAYVENSNICVGPLTKDVLNEIRFY